MALMLGLAAAVIAHGALARTPTLTRPPELLKVVEPEYPVEALADRAEGPVELVVDIDASGEVVRAAVVSAPHPTLGVAALDAASRMLFRPAEIDGRPSAIRIAYTFHFALGAAPQTPPEPADLPARPAQDAAPTAARPALVPHAAAPDQPSEPAQSYEAVVRTTAPPPPVTHRRIETAELESVPGAFGDPLRVLESLPGVGRSPFSSGILVMRGSSPDESGVYLDGHPVPLLYHFGGGPSVIPPDAIESIEMATGGFGARYGRAIGGVVDVKSRPGRRDGFHGAADIDLIDAGAALEGPIGALGSFRISGRRSYLDTLIPLIPGDTGQRALLTLAPRYYDYHGRADVEPTEGIALSLVASGSDDALTFASSTQIFDVPPELSLETSAHRINPRLQLDLGHGFELRLSPALAWMHTGGRTPFEFLEVQSTQQALRAELLARGPWTTTTLGVDAVRDQFRFTARVPVPGAREFPSADPREPAAADVHGHLRIVQAGVYGETQVEIGRLRVTPGVRLEHVERQGRAESALDPRLDVRARLAGGLVAKATAGRYHRVPNPEEIARATGNPDLTLESSTQGSIGIDWRLLDAYVVDLQAFAKRMDDMARRTSEVYFFGGRLDPVRYESNSEGRAWGLEAMLARRVSRGVSGWIAYTLCRSERRHAGGDWSLYARDQTHNLNAVLSVDLPWALRLGGRYRYVTGYPATPIVSAGFDTDTARYVPERGELNAVRLPAFQQLDLRLEKLFGERRAAHVTAYLDVQNVTNRRNAEFFQYSYDFSKRYDFPGLPILPSLGLEAGF
jgi:TonB family protein